MFFSHIEDRIRASVGHKEATILTDFQHVRRIAMTKPLMAEIERAFAIASP